MAFRVTQVPSDFESGGKIHYLETKAMYKKFWSKYQECFVFEGDTKYIISINQMHRALTDWTNWGYKKKGMLDPKHYFVNMHDPSIK